MENHWSKDFSLFDAMAIAELTGYEVEPEIFDKRDYVLGLACHIIQHPHATHATGHDAVHRFLRRAQGAVWRA